MMTNSSKPETDSRLKLCSPSYSYVHYRQTIFKRYINREVAKRRRESGWRELWDQEPQEATSCTVTRVGRLSDRVGLILNVVENKCNLMC